MSKKIAIIGGGCAGLHLALYLQKHGVEPTIFTDRKSEEFASLPLLNTSAHHHVTLEREAELGITHWPAEEYGYFGHNYSVSGDQPLEFYGAYKSPSRVVDYRIYLPRLQDDFIERGGDIRFQSITQKEVPEIEAEYDLIVACTGKGPFGEMFDNNPEFSPFDSPQRMLCAGLYKGVEPRESRAVTLYFSPEVGQIIELPTLTFSGMSTALLFESYMGGDCEIVGKTKYKDDPKAFLSLVLEKVKKYYPSLADRINEDEFDLANGPLDLLQGAVRPVMRETYKELDSGKLVVAVGDIHGTVDPLLGQGSNMASYGAFVLGEEILRSDVFDRRFIEAVDRKREDRVQSATCWTNYMLEHLQAQTPAVMDFLVNIMPKHQQLVDEFTWNFNYPEKQWDIFSSAERFQAWIQNRLSA